jgi:hypothetical protein
VPDKLNWSLAMKLLAAFLLLNDLDVELAVLARKEGCTKRPPVPLTNDLFSSNIC